MATYCGTMTAIRNLNQFCIFQELRRRRNEVTVDLRKQKKEDMLSKRRNVCLDDTDEGPVSPLQVKSDRFREVDMQLFR
jgi:hypothetical protein